MKKILIIGGYPKSLIQFRGKLLEIFIKQGYEVTACSDGYDEKISAKLNKMGVEDKALKEIDVEIKSTIADAAKFAQDSPEPSASELFTDITIN